MIRQASAWMLALLLGVATAVAQQGTTEVRGRVLDPQGAMLPGVTVTVRNQDTGMFRETISGQDGTFIVGGIVPGRYELSAELQGFKKFLRRGVELEIGKTTSVDVPLEVGSLSEVVNVSAETPMLDVTSKEVGGNITSRELVELPTINGNFVGFVGLLPGIVPTISTESFGSDSIAVNGQDPRNNNYMLDGGNNNDDVIGQRAGTQARTPIEAIQEFQVITNQFDAEFGRTTGACPGASGKCSRALSSMPWLKSIPTTRSRQSGRTMRIAAPVPQQRSSAASIVRAPPRYFAIPPSMKSGVRNGV